MWDATTGTRQYIFEGHEAPVYSVCPHYKENIQVLFLILIVIFDSRASSVAFVQGEWTIVQM